MCAFGIIVQKEGDYYVNLLRSIVVSRDASAGGRQKKYRVARESISVADQMRTPQTPPVEKRILISAYSTCSPVSIYFLSLRRSGMNYAREELKI